jgi:hypothetical protein
MKRLNKKAYAENSLEKYACYGAGSCKCDGCKTPEELTVPLGYGINQALYNHPSV